MTKRKREVLKCPSCGTVSELENITVRVYRKRSQTDFRFRLCLECRLVLEAFLEGPAESVQHGMYLEPTYG